jgi:hypothetical protein
MGFTVAPDKLQHVPEGESFELTLTYTPNEEEAAAGVVEAILPVFVRGGSAVLVYLTATMVVPDVKMNSDHIEFDQTYFSFSIFC